MKKVRLERLHIKNFRGIKDLSFERFGGVNILLGQNNVGKTSILEAIVLSSAPSDIMESTRYDGYARDISMEELYKEFTFLGSDKAKNLHLSGTWNNREISTLS